MTLLPRTDPLSQQQHKQKHQRLPRVQTTAVEEDYAMDAQQSPDATRRPQIYIHFEFGVSYSPRRPGNRHSLTYMSRNRRDRTGFPRQLPPTNTNYLEFTSIPAHEQQQQQQLTQPRFQPHPQAETQPQSQTRTPPRPLPDSHPELQLQPGAQLLQQVDTPAEPTQRAASPRGRQRSVAHPNLPVSQTLLYPPFNRRQSRADSHSSGSSHERGTSAPPPWNQRRIPYHSSSTSINTKDSLESRPQPSRKTMRWTPNSRQTPLGGLRSTFTSSSAYLIHHDVLATDIA
ncbi:hypothetical protein BN1723_012956 [Verticillium longisporum]|uniref:Uncharacterized protein n=1 Tax=Verticillium longisporum TaxID=100787 RepID=A0A0G4LMU3_VERLO|nr:hypothetical protein BN1723_012956 [Verticillium longisporum]